MRRKTFSNAGNQRISLKHCNLRDTQKDNLIQALFASTAVTFWIVTQSTHMAKLKVHIWTWLLDLKCRRTAIYLTYRHFIMKTRVRRGSIALHLLWSILSRLQKFKPVGGFSSSQVRAGIGTMKGSFSCSLSTCIRPLRNKKHQISASENGMKIPISAFLRCRILTTAVFYHFTTAWEICLKHNQSRQKHCLQEREKELDRKLWCLSDCQNKAVFYLQWTIA